MYAVLLAAVLAAGYPLPGLPKLPAPPSLPSLPSLPDEEPGQPSYCRFDYQCGPMGQCSRGVCFLRQR